MLDHAFAVTNIAKNINAHVTLMCTSYETTIGKSSSFYLSFSGIVLVPAPVNVDVLSNNFIHILRWSPGNGTQPGTVYNVNVR